MFSLLSFKQDVCYHSSIFGNAYLEDLKSLERPSELLALGFETEGSPHHLRPRRVAGNHQRRPPPTRTCTPQLYLATCFNLPPGAGSRWDTEKRATHSTPASYCTLILFQMPDQGQAVALFSCEVAIMITLLPVLKTEIWHSRQGTIGIGGSKPEPKNLCSNEPYLKAPFSSPEPCAEAKQW